MTLLYLITLLLNPFNELKSNNERLRWELADQLTEYRHLVQEYEMYMFREQLYKVNIGEFNWCSTYPMEEVMLNEREKRRTRELDMTSLLNGGIYLFNWSSTYPMEEY